MQIATDDRPDEPAAQFFGKPELAALDEGVATIPDLWASTSRSAAGFEVAGAEIVAVDSDKVLVQFHAGLVEFATEGQPNPVQCEIFSWLSMEEIDFGRVGKGSIEGVRGFVSQTDCRNEVVMKDCWLALVPTLCRNTLLSKDSFKERLADGDQAPGIGGGLARTDPAFCCALQLIARKRNALIRATRTRSKASFIFFLLAAWLEAAHGKD
jgi:hypothetical protein